MHKVKLQIGFLVPGSALSALLVNHQEVPSAKPLLQSIADQIASHTSSMVAAALDTEWERAQLGGVMISSSPLPWLECWGNSDKDKKAQTFTVSRGCHSGQALYLSHGFSSGYFEYEYMFFEAKPGTYELTEESVGTRFASMTIRTAIQARGTPSCSEHRSPERRSGNIGTTRSGK